MARSIYDFELGKNIESNVEIYSKYTSPNKSSEVSDIDIMWDSWKGNVTLNDIEMVWHAWVNNEYQSFQDWSPTPIYHYSKSKAIRLK